MATLKQKEVAKALIENSTLDNPKNGGEILESIGYSPSIVKNPQMILNTQGVKDALAEYGFTAENAKMVVTDILLDEKTEANTRLKAADMVFKVDGTYAAEKTTSLNVNVDLKKTDKSELESMREEYEEILKNKLTQ